MGEHRTIPDRSGHWRDPGVYGWRRAYEISVALGILIIAASAVAGAVCWAVLGG